MENIGNFQVLKHDEQLPWTNRHKGRECTSFSHAVLLISLNSRAKNKGNSKVLKYGEQLPWTNRHNERECTSFAHAVLLKQSNF